MLFFETLRGAQLPNSGHHSWSNGGEVSAAAVPDRSFNSCRVRSHARDESLLVCPTAWPASCNTLRRCMFSWWDGLRLKSSNPRTRSKAVENLSGSTHSRDTERLLASLQDKSPHVRCAAVRALAESRSPDSLKSLLSALSDVSPEVREAAATVLGRSG